MIGNENSLEVGQRLRLTAEGDAEDHEVGPLHGLRVLEALEMASWHCVAGALCGLMGPPRVS
jgi:hypothetical protein